MLTYALSVKAFNLAGVLLLFLILRPAAAIDLSRVQYGRQLYDEHQLAVLWWEMSLSYFSQMAGLTVQNFVSAGTGIAVAIAPRSGSVKLNAHEAGPWSPH